MNFYNEHPFRVLLDYAHNAHGMQAMTRLIRGLTVHGRRIGVIAAPGDRRDEDIAELAAAAAPAFDLVLVREDDNRRGRPPGEVGELLRRGLVAAGFPADAIAPEIHGEEAAVAKALATARAGDLVVIFGDQLARVWEQIVTFGGEREAATAAAPAASAIGSAATRSAPLPAVPGASGAPVWPPAERASAPMADRFETPGEPSATVATAATAAAGDEQMSEDFED